MVGSIQSLGWGVFKLKTFAVTIGDHLLKKVCIIMQKNLVVSFIIAIFAYTIKEKDMDTIKKFKVEFKETYFPHSVERECHVTSEREVIKIYGLDQPDIEWYKITEIK